MQRKRKVPVTLKKGIGNGVYRTEARLNRKIPLEPPEMLKVKEGFHHDLNANAIDELRGPTFA